jgi:hypothetical protein
MRTSAGILTDWRQKYEFSKNRRCLPLQTGLCLQTGKSGNDIVD